MVGNSKIICALEAGGNRAELPRIFFPLALEMIQNFDLKMGLHRLFLFAGVDEIVADKDDVQIAPMLLIKVGARGLEVKIEMTEKSQVAQAVLPKMFLCIFFACDIAVAKGDDRGRRPQFFNLGPEEIQGGSTFPSRCTGGGKVENENRENGTLTKGRTQAEF